MVLEPFRALEYTAASEVHLDHQPRHERPRHEEVGPSDQLHVTPLHLGGSGTHGTTSSTSVLVQACRPAAQGHESRRTREIDQSLPANRRRSLSVRIVARRASVPANQKISNALT